MAVSRPNTNTLCLIELPDTSVQCARAHQCFAFGPDVWYATDLQKPMHIQVPLLACHSSGSAWNNVPCAPLHIQVYAAKDFTVNYYNTYKVGGGRSAYTSW